MLLYVFFRIELFWTLIDVDSSLNHLEIENTDSCPPIINAPWARRHTPALKHKTGRHGIERGLPEFWYHLIAVGMFLGPSWGSFFGGCVCQDKFEIVDWYLFSNTLELMGLDELHLRVLARFSEDYTQRRHAQKSPDEIIRLLIIFWRQLKLMQKGRHWVLVVR